MLDLSWYITLIKPAFTPPAWVFAPAWIFLYITIFVALAAFALTKSSRFKGFGYTYFIMQLIFNILWTPAFFILHNLQLSVTIIVILDILVMLNIIEFYKVSKFSALILIPYFLWIIFATYLNIGIMVLN